MKITLTNDFHNTSIELDADVRQCSDGSAVACLTIDQIKQAKRSLCGYEDCTCSNDAGTRGGQETSEGKPLHIDCSAAVRYEDEQSEATEDEDAPDLPTSIVAFWDESDPGNKGWAYKVSYGIDHEDSGPLNWDLPEDASEQELTSLFNRLAKPFGVEPESVDFNKGQSSISWEAS